MRTGFGADANGCDGLVTGSNAASGFMGVGGISASLDACGAGDTTSGVGGAASFVPNTNSSIALPSGLRFLVLISTLP
jgi:hypothetical protein